MLFRKKRPVTVTFIDSETKSVIGQDSILPDLIPIDFDFPTTVEIDGQHYTLKAADPVDRKQARKAGNMTVWVELLPVVVPEGIQGAEQSPEEGGMVANSVPSTAYFRNPSVADPQPRLSVARNEYRFWEMMPSDWRSMEFIQRQFAPEVGEELSDIEQVRQSAAVVLDGQTFYAEQHVRSLTSLPLRSIELDDLGLQTRFFPLSTRLDGVIMMGTHGFVDAGFAYRLHSKLVFYGQEIDRRIRSIGVCLPDASTDPTAIGEDVKAICAMMKTLDLILVDWNRLEAVEADEAELAAFLSARL
jgi:hypothetical protein